MMNAGAPPQYDPSVRRLRHILFNSLTALSFLLCITMITFWIRSATIGDYVRWYNQPRLFEFTSSGGIAMLALGELVSTDYPVPSGWEGSFWPFTRNVDTFSADLRRGTTLGFEFRHWRKQTRTLREDSRTVKLPYWFVVICLGVTPTVRGLRFWRSRRRRKRGKLGLCPTCGYDLRASPQRCPECGGEVASDARRRLDTRGRPRSTPSDVFI